jgi:hypothetical protein
MDEKENIVDKLRGIKHIKWMIFLCIIAGFIVLPLLIGLF